MSMYWILFIGIAVASYLVQSNLKRKFEVYSRQPCPYSGKEVAEMMLRAHGIYDVRVISTSGRLTDHYNPTDKTVNLSEDVYASYSVAAAAVAAHECGHAVQHACAYGPLKMRSALVPAVSFASSWMQWILLIGIFTIQTFPQIMLGGIILCAMTTLLRFITLPVEINASMRATRWLRQADIVSPSSYPMAVDALRSAAYTYVVAALSSLATLVYYVSIFLGRRD